MYENIRLIASDFDGTLARDNARFVEEPVFDMIRECRKNDIFFVVASGRPCPSLQRIFEPVRQDVIFVSDSGALVTHGDETLYRHTLERELGLSILEDIYGREGCEIMVTTGPRYVYFRPKTDVFRQKMQTALGDAAHMIDNFKSIDGEFLKITSISTEGNASVMVPVFKKVWGEEIGVKSAGSMWVDFCCVGKEDALQALTDNLHIEKKQVMAFGDSENDEGMMRLAAFSWAMETASPDLKKLCGGVCRSVEEVVRQVLNERRR